MRGCAFELIRYAKENGVALVLVGHVTKDGSIAGPRVLEHMVDVVMSFEGERSHQYRILRALKNRFGAVDEIGVFAMEGGGLAEVANPSLLFLSGRERAGRRQRGVPGARRHAAGAGRSPGADRAAAIGRTPRRAVVGWDSGRLAMLLAVLEARCGLNFSSAEVYLNVAGGYRLVDPAADRRGRRGAGLGACRQAAPCPTACGSAKVSLAGEIRPVAHGGLRCARRPSSASTAARGPCGGCESPQSMRPMKRLNAVGQSR